jgi:uridine kinase
VEHNICYRSLSGRHYHCSVYNDSTDTWQTFNAESSLPGDGDWAFAETANVYRSTYAAQKDTPPFLKAEGEYVPSILNDPCIKDVTAYLSKTVSVTLPFHENTNSNLAYLATYSRDWQGVIPVTWEVIDRSRSEVTFSNAMPGLLYFPIYYPDEHCRTFGQPFYIEILDSVPVIREIPYIDDADTSRTSVILTRKYPRKPNMRRVAEELVGGRVLGSRKGDFTDAVTLLEIKEPPQPALLTYPLSNVGHYKSYRFQTSKEHPHAHISMLEWLTSESYGYSNTMLPMRRHVLSPSDTIAVNSEKNLMRLMDGESVEVPRYDFITGSRKWHDNPLQLGEKSIIIMEGIHALNPRLTPSIPRKNKFGIYASCLTSVAMDNLTRIQTTDNRLLRRITRDYATRGADALATLRRWPSVRRGEEKHIFPYQENADVIFNTSLFYEILVLRPKIEPILREVPDTEPEYGEARRLLQFLDNFTPLHTDEIPPTSILREFVGGSTFKY